MISYRKIEPRITYRNLNLSEVEVSQEAVTFPFTANAGIGGTISPSSFDAPIDSLVAVVITPDTGYTFVRALVNGVETQQQSFALKMERAYTVVAEFEQGSFKTLTVEQVGFGTMFPAAGTYQKEVDEVVSVLLIPTNTQDESDKGIEWYAEGVMVDGVESFDNPTEVVMDENHDVTGVFKTYDQQLKVFDSAPVLKGNQYYFGDHSTKDNDVLIKNVKVGNFSTPNNYIDTQLFIVGGTFNFTFDFNLVATGATKTILRCGGAAANQKGINININSLNVFQIITSDGTSVSATYQIQLQFNANNYYNISITWNGLTGGTMTVIINGLIYTTTTMRGWTGNSFETAKVGYSNSTLSALVHKISVSNVFSYILNHGQGAVLYNLLGGVNGTVTGAVLSTFWGSNSDEAIPYDAVLGATLYQNNSDQTIMPICYNKPEEIVGYTRLGYFPPNSGILKGLPNKYTIPVDSVLNNHIPAGDYTEAQIRALVQSDRLIKDEDTNTISLLKVREKFIELRDSNNDIIYDSENRAIYTINTL